MSLPFPAPTTRMHCVANALSLEDTDASQVWATLALSFPEVAITEYSAPEGSLIVPELAYRAVCAAVVLLLREVDQNRIVLSEADVSHFSTVPASITSLDGGFTEIRLTD
jgi:hypothetical protein